MSYSSTEKTAFHDILPQDWLTVVRAKVEGLRYGAVQIVVHDGKVTQVERTEKTRIASSREG
ncbi:MAG: YezD family protein [Puniceicoccales bacterium]|jgi:hypothetical protein|nr:YezD family protein [Puniceicoccales bacterium]